MTKLLVWFEFAVDYLLVNRPRQEDMWMYHRYMHEKYGDLYCTQQQWEELNNS